MPEFAEADGLPNTIVVNPVCYKIRCSMTFKRTAVTLLIILKTVSLSGIDGIAPRSVVVMAPHALAK